MEVLTCTQLTTVNDHVYFFLEIDGFEQSGSEIQIEENSDNKDEIDLIIFFFTPKSMVNGITVSSETAVEVINQVANESLGVSQISHSKKFNYNNSGIN